MRKETPQDRWLARNSVKLTIRFMADSDKDVIERLNSVQNKTDYIRTLIRADIEQAVTKEDKNDRFRVHKCLPEIRKGKRGLGRP